MKITKGELRRIIKEEKARLVAEATARKIIRQSLMSEFFGLGKKKAAAPKFPEVDLQRLGEIIEDHAFEEDLPADSPRRDLSVDSNLEWLATSDEEIRRLGKAYKRSPEEIQTFLGLDLEQRKKMIRGR